MNHGKLQLTVDMGLFDNLTLADLMHGVCYSISGYKYFLIHASFEVLYTFFPHYACPQNSISLSGAFNCIK